MNETVEERQETTRRLLGSLRTHQHEAVAKIHSCNGRCALWMEMGLGKTRVGLVWVYARKHKRVLVVCPLSVAGIWADEVAKLGLPYPVYDLTHGPSIAARAATLRATGDGIVLVNYESCWRKPLRQAILDWEPEALIADEGHRLKNRATRQSKFLHLLADRVPCRLLLTGTPVTQGLEDMWSQLRVVDKGLFGPWGQFEADYLIRGGYGGHQIVGYQNEDRARRLAETRSYQLRKDAVLDLPPRTDVTVPVTLSPATRRAYDAMKANAIARLKALDGQEGIAVARIVLTSLLRLQQCTGGYMRDEDGNDLDLGTEKLDAACDLIGDAVAEGQPVVVFARFRHDLDRLQHALGRYSVARIDGSTPGPERTRLLAGFRAGLYEVFLLQLRAGSVGIDLSRASVALFYSHGFSLDDYLQARDRIHRPGQTRPVTYYHLVARDSVDAAVYVALAQKTSIARACTSLSYAESLLST